MSRIAVVVPNWNGEKVLSACLDSLLAQTQKAHIVVVDNGSVDASLSLLKNYPDVEVIALAKNRGFASGMNTGIQKALDKDFEYVAAFNNDAVADKHWLKRLVGVLGAKPGVGIATCKLLSADGRRIDSTGDQYTTWGLPYPRGRGEENLRKYDALTNIFAASGGASLYRAKTLKEIGLFDEDFFAYYEDVDLSFRAQLGGWQIAYVPAAIAYHATGSTSRGIPGFTIYQTLKNLPLLFWKNVPSRLMVRVWPRFMLAYILFLLRPLGRGQVWPVCKGLLLACWLCPKKLAERYHIQKSRKVTDKYIWGMFVHDLPPNAQNLRRLRSLWRNLRSWPKA